MRYLLIAVLTLYICSCSATPAKVEPAAQPVAIPTAEIHAACRDFLKDTAVKTVHGITLRQIDDYFVAGADVSDAGQRRSIIDLMVRQYDDGSGRKYWKAETLSLDLVNTLNNRKGEK